VIIIRDNTKGGALTEVTFLILLSVYTPNHGYGILQWIQKETNGRVILGAGTLYGAINTLLKKRWIEAVSQDAGERKKEYIITALGKSMAEAEINRLAGLLFSAQKIMKVDKGV
jgi:DNA-binding PadR family transcriptional regulator